LLRRAWYEVTADHTGMPLENMQAKQPAPFGDGSALTAGDAWLVPYTHMLKARQKRFADAYAVLQADFGSLDALSRGHLFFGFNRGEQAGVPGLFYREWAPGADALALVGDFNDWDRQRHPLKRDAYGVYSLFLPDTEVGPAVPHMSRVKVHVQSARGAEDRIPAYIRRAVQDPATHDFSGQHWSPPVPYAFSHEAPKSEEPLRIYEAHVGMASEAGKVGTFTEFTRDVLPKIAALGYNTVQLMAVMEHPYYGSFGYHVSNFFAVSSRFGTPEELKALVDTAHALGLRVLLDLVHSHAVKNTAEGLCAFDGTDHQYFHALPRGFHVAWDSMLFDYQKPEVLRFLLSNVRFWLEEYRFDGFRFDGITSMLYLDHGLGKAFGGYDDYFGANIDEDAIVYLKLANVLAHQILPSAITIAEDVSGMVGMARPVAEGGLGFDYRLAMGIPDYWIKLIKEQRDEDWQMGELYWAMLNRRRNERHVAYAESHDQALVGDKTLAFRLMDAEMYWNMARGRETPVIERGLALHKLIRLITFTLGGEAWLNFMGNEFGHPEWVDFPREGNQWSYHHARRQWSLASDPNLHYQDLLRFDHALQALDRDHNLLAASLIEELYVHEEHKLLICRRGSLVLAFNFHPDRSAPDLRIPLPEARDYRVALDTDAGRYGGFARIPSDASYPWLDAPWCGKEQSARIYLPARTGLVLAPK
jgi:1,4-alpha-glucan branching enzyme